MSLDDRGYSRNGRTSVFSNSSLVVSQSNQPVQDGVSRQNKKTTNMRLTSEQALLMLNEGE